MRIITIAAVICTGLLCLFHCGSKNPAGNGTGPDQGIPGKPVTDIDGNAYQTVRIGNQLWMAENLRVTHYRNGDAILKITSDSGWEDMQTGAYCAYDNDENIADIYGYLYNWFALNDSRNIAPAGWRVPTENDWQILETWLGMKPSQADSTGERGTDEGDKLKSEDGWPEEDTGTNESGFSALPGGCRDPDGFFDDMGFYTGFWSATAYTDRSAYSRTLYYQDSYIYRGTFNKGKGWSVRLISDDSPIHQPTSQVDYIEVSPSTLTLVTGQNRQFKCYAKFSDGGFSVITDNAVWTTMPGTSGTIDQSGLFTALDVDGVETVTAVYKNHTAQATVSVFNCEAILSGTWKAAEEKIDISSWGMGIITVDPASDLFLNLVITIDADGTFYCERWYGHDKNDREADWKAYNGDWSRDAYGVYLTFHDSDMQDMAGRFDCFNCTLEFKTQMVFESVDPSAPFPVTFVMEKTGG
ncbi:hypothetical protein JW948_16480 [bacterium]|nr:hypothetical protein [bacterium]